ncbi:MAG: NUDIX domain-containing protein [Gemmataceae bacterium]
MSEMVDVIDDAGRTIGIVTRREMRENRLPHRCVYVLVFDRDGRLFIHLRTATKDINPGYWDVAAGGVLSAGESFDEGAVRELEEELGVTAPLEPLFPFRYADDRTIVQAMVYRTTHEGPFRFQPEEVVCGEFRTLEEIDELTRSKPFCPDGLQVLNLFRANG